MSEIKVAYTALSGYISKAYVDEDTLIGTDKYTDEPLMLVWNSERSIYEEEEGE